MSNIEEIFDQPLCPRCLGRGFAKLGKGLSNYERGMIIFDRLGIDTPESDPGRTAADDAVSGYNAEISTIFPDEIKEEFPASIVEPGDCWLCEGLMGEIIDFAKILEKDLSGYEFDNLLVGSKVDSELMAREDALWNTISQASPESIKVELNREIGKILNELLQKPTEFSAPDIVAVIDTRFNVSDISPSPLFFFGRYLKLKRGIPQTKWHCKKCRGKGCEHCSGTGKMYETSVEELIAAPAVATTAASDFALHGMGREDIDVLMLGTGRPFVLELSRPKQRKPDLERLTSKINEKNPEVIEVRELRPSTRKEMISIKMAKTYKTYRCRIVSESPVVNENLKKVVNRFVGKVISQKTPIRVKHRRADKLRKRTVANIYIESHTDRELTLDIKAESGLYIKELIHGDDGRTQPNLSDELNTKCEVKELDVLKVHDDE
jgi:tRNA pseudouridine synthase 10